MQEALFRGHASHPGFEERQCGERLFVRTGRGVVLTEFGAQLLPRMARLALNAEVIADDIRAARGRPVGEVLIGLLPSAVRRYTGLLATAVRGQMPGVRMHLMEGASALLEEQLREGRLDMAVVLREDEASIGDSPESHLISKPSEHQRVSLVWTATRPLCRRLD